MRRKGDHCDRSARHVEEFDTIALFAAWDDVVFDDSAHGIFVAYGVVLASEWNPWVGDHHYDIQVCQSKTQIKAWGFHFEVATPEVMRMGFVKIDGGFPEFARQS